MHTMIGNGSNKSVLPGERYRLMWASGFVENKIGIRNLDFSQQVKIQKNVPVL